PSSFLHRNSKTSSAGLASSFGFNHRVTPFRSLEPAHHVSRRRPRKLERKLGRKLQLPWSVCIYDLAERRAIRVAVDRLRAEELRMIEDVEGLHPEKQLPRFT